MHATVGPEIVARSPLRLPPSVETPAASTVIVRAVVTSTGRVARTQILRGPQVPELDEAVIQALREWRFKPAEHDGRPVAVYMNLELSIVPSTGP